jgi:diacylglycerol O-acyltransferase
MHRPIPLLELAFLWIDRPNTPSNVGVLMLFEPPQGQDASRTAREVLKAYRAARPVAPFDSVPVLPFLGLAHWGPAGRYRPERHVLHHRLPAPASPARLREFVARLHEPQLDRSRPLFELHLIEGLASGQFAVYIKSHHATWDGRIALARILASSSAAPGRILPPFFAVAMLGSARPAGVAPGLATLQQLLRQAAALPELVARLAGRSTGARPGARPIAGNTPFAGPHTRLDAPIEAGRAVATFSLPLERMRAVARTYGGTLNDVVVTVIDAGIQAYLAARGERPREPLVAMCPVSQRAADDLEATLKVATLFVRLGPPGAGVGRRMESIVASTAAAKREMLELSDAAAQDFGGLAFGLSFAAQALGLGAATRPVVNLVISNVGAVPGARYLGRSRLVGTYPISMIAEPLGLNVTTLSCDGHMDFGLLANRAAVPDPDAIARGCGEAFDRLQQAARRRQGGPGHRNFKRHRQGPARSSTG